MGATLERGPTLIDTTNHLSHELGPRALRERRRMRWTRRAMHGAQTARDLAHHRTVLVRAPPRGAQHERLVGLDRARRRARRAGVARVKRVKVPRFVVALGAPSADVDKRDGLRRSGGALKQLAFKVALRIHCGGALCCELLLVRALRDVERRRGFRGERCLLRRELLRVRRVETRELGRRVVKSARVRL